MHVVRSLEKSRIASRHRGCPATRGWTLLRDVYRLRCRHLRLSTLPACRHSLSVDPPSLSTLLPCRQSRLRLINGGAEGIQKFSIDGYKLTVFANDFVPVVPYDVDVVTLGIGQQTDVIVKATGSSTDTVWMRSTLGTSAFSGGCTLNDGISPEAVAAIYYENANTSAIPTTISSVPDSEIELCANDALADTVPYFSLTPPRKPETTQEVSITFQSNGTHNLFYMNNSTFRADSNDPLLLEAKLGKTEFPAQSNVYDFGESKSIRLVVYNYAFTGVHPMHMHGHNMYSLAVGTGTWDGTVTNAPNAQNPQKTRRATPSSRSERYEARIHRRSDRHR